MEVRREFDPSASSVAAARGFVAAALVEAGVGGSALVEKAQLVVSELATNAVVHAGTTFEVIVDVDADVRLAVRDGCADPPVRRSTSGLLDGGRGLVLVEAIADQWGVEPDGDGKRVWCRLAAP